MATRIRTRGIAARAHHPGGMRPGFPHFDSEYIRRAAAARNRSREDFFDTASIHSVHTADEEFMRSGATAVLPLVPATPAGVGAGGIDMVLIGLVFPCSCSMPILFIFPMLG